MHNPQEISSNNSRQPTAVIRRIPANRAPGFYDLATFASFGSFSK
jgi:hypothetical protein